MTHRDAKPENVSLPREKLVGYFPPEATPPVAEAIIRHGLPFRFFASRKHPGLYGLAQQAATEEEEQAARNALWDAAGERDAPSGALAAWKRRAGSGPRRRRHQGRGRP